MSEIERFRRRPTVTAAIRWDGSDKARTLIAQHSGKPVPSDTNRGALSVWVQKAADYRWLPMGDWAVLEADGTGVWLLAEAKRREDYDPAGSCPVLSPPGQVSVDVRFMRSTLVDAIRACERDDAGGDPEAADFLAEYRAALAGLQQQAGEPR